MAKKYDNDLSFYEVLLWYYRRNKGKIQKHYKGITKKLLAYNDRGSRPEAFLRLPQFEAFEIYVFFKEYLDNMSVREAFEEWRSKSGKLSDVDDVGTGGRLFDVYTERQTEEVFKQLTKVDEPYPNYIYALTMGLGKTVLMATCIFYEFLLANKFPKDERFCHNALVFAPDKTVLQSLKEIVSLDKSLIIPSEYEAVIESNLKFLISLRTLPPLSIRSTTLTSTLSFPTTRRSSPSNATSRTLRRISCSGWLRRCLRKRRRFWQTCTGRTSHGTTRASCSTRGTLNSRGCDSWACM